MARSIRQAVADGEAVFVRETITRYGTEYVAVAGGIADRTRQMIDMDICWLDRADAAHWAKREGVVLTDEEPTA